MVSHSHSTEPRLTTPNALPIRHRWLVGTALGLSLLSMSASGVLLAQVRTLDQKIQDVAAVSGSGQEHTTLKAQVANLNKTLQGQTTQVTELGQSVSNTKQSVSQLRQDIMKLDARVNTMSQPVRASVNIGVTQPQEIGHGFWVTDLMAISQGRGTRLVGTVVNSSAVKYTDVIFNVKIGDQAAKPLRVAAIAAGSEESFRLDFPDVEPKQAVKGEINYVSANLMMWVGE